MMQTKKMRKKEEIIKEKEYPSDMNKTLILH